MTTYERTIDALSAHLHATYADNISDFEFADRVDAVLAVLVPEGASL